MHVETVRSGDLPQPGILASPRMVHMHGALSDRVERISLFLHHGTFERRVPHRDGIEVALDSLARPFRRNDFAMAFRSQAEILQRFAIQLEDCRLGLGIEAHLDRPFQIRGVRVLEVGLLRLKVLGEKSAVFNIPVQLTGVGASPSDLSAVLPSPAGQGSHAGHPFMVDHIVRISAGKFRGAVFVHEARQFQPRAEIDQHFLEASDVPVRLDHGVPD